MPKASQTKLQTMEKTESSAAENKEVHSPSTSAEESISSVPILDEIVTT